ncbi:hypothetical protein T02_7961 [Trichinella nativa]|uniref:Uncharacterized protein n=1 Tax=Trichinella nativa TaxID=6335 RepID=A0A0V1L247_9BILA|nr:hypothetical protein T02_7961 [Trichinella nativa]OUC40378.1 hypothetical protein D917_04123 [Trichinella nativa]
MSAQRSAIENAWAETGENFCEMFLDKFSSARYAHATAALLPGRKRAGVLEFRLLSQRLTRPTSKTGFERTGP